MPPRNNPDGRAGKKEPAPGQTGRIPLTSIRIGAQKVRVDINDDGIIELSASIAKHGLLEPIVVRVTEDGYYQLVAGARRLMAHFRLKAHEIFAHVLEDHDTPLKVLAFVENNQRQAMTLEEEVDAMKWMSEEGGLSVEQICDALGRSRSWVLNRLMVRSLPDFLREPLLAGDLPIGQVEEISRVPDEGAQRYVTSMAVQNRWNRSQTRQVAEVYINSPSVGQVTSAEKVPGLRPPNIPEVVYLCEGCGKKGRIEDFALVRVCKDGCRSEPVSDRPGESGDPGDGVEGDDD